MRHFGGVFISPYKLAPQLSIHVRLRSPHRTCSDYCGTLLWHVASVVNVMDIYATTIRLESRDFIVF